MKHFVDISTVHAAAGAPPRGVTRVEFNVARAALSCGAELVRFDATPQRFVTARLPTNFGQARDEIRLILTQTPRLRAPLAKLSAIRKLRSRGRFLKRRAAAPLDAELEAARRELAWQLAYHYEYVHAVERIELASLAQALEPQPLCHEFGYWIRVERGKRLSRDDAVPALPTEFTSADKLLSLGAAWNAQYIDALEKLAAQGVTVVALVYDMIPITHPEFLRSEEVDRFKIYLGRMLKSSIRLTTISQSSQQEITRYGRDKLGISKHIAVTPLASSVSEAPAVPSARILQSGLQNRPFALMAGSFEPRKNQKFVLEIWRSVVSRLTEPPILVFAGGLADASYLQELQQLARDVAGVLFFFNVDDEELAWAYENCLFTFFPSQAEGWGLPITEALDRGKHCLASDNTSLREAGEGLIFHAALEDREAWSDELHKLLSDPRILEERTDRIRKIHHKRTWAEVSRALMAL